MIVAVGLGAGLARGARRAVGASALPVYNLPPVLTQLPGGCTGTFGLVYSSLDRGGLASTAAPPRAIPRCLPSTTSQVGGSTSTRELDRRTAPCQVISAQHHLLQASSEAPPLRNRASASSNGRFIPHGVNAIKRWTS
jgi:hypothetical protein